MNSSSIKTASVRAPSNIALVKYMGKTSADGNRPANGSLSLTLNNLCTGIELEAISEQSGLGFISLSEPPKFSAPTGFQWLVPALSEKGTQRFAKHAERCLQELPKIFLQHALPLHVSLVQSLNEKSMSLALRSANTFPAGAGIASSASSFAALTLSMAVLLTENENEMREQYRVNTCFRRALAALSQKGSGSSCRSFEGPFVKWSHTETIPVPSKLPVLTDFVLIISSEEKTVGSSEAHARVLTSPLWQGPTQGRPERAEAKLKRVQTAIAEGNLEALSHEVFEEAEDMHGLFHTAQPPFTYQTPDTHEVLKKLKAHPARHQALITLDAGPNVHVIVPTSHAQEWRAYFTKEFPKLKVLEDTQGEGAEIV